MSNINAKLAKIFRFPENTTRADIRIRLGSPPEVDLTYFIVHENSIPKEIECRFELVEINNEDE